MTLHLGLFIFGLSWTSSVLLTAVMRHLGPRLGLVDQPGRRRVHERPTPKSGGIAIFLATLLPAVGCLVLSRIELEKLPGFFQRLSSAVAEDSQTILVIFCGALVFVIIGLIDDLRGLSVPWRLVIEVLAAGAVFYYADRVKITFFSPYPFTWLILTVLWIVGITNSFNLLDNMDGLSAGVALIVSGILLCVALKTDQTVVTVLLLAFMGALGG